MIALSPHARSALGEQLLFACVVLYQIGLVFTAAGLTFAHRGRCPAIFNCMVQWAADLFCGIVWPLYWLVKLTH